MTSTLARGHPAMSITAMLLSMLLPACAPDTARRTGSGFGMDSVLWSRMLAAEDSRGSAAGGVSALVEGLKAPNPAIRRLAVRGLGRLERDSFVTVIAPLLADGEAAVRAEAANAIGQAARRADYRAVSSLLLPHLSTEPDGRVIGVLAETLGRLGHEDSASVATTAHALADLASPGAVMGQTLGVVRGLHFLARQPAARGSLPPDAVGALHALAVAPPQAGADTLVARRIRTVAAAALSATGQATVADLSAVLGDPDPWVRREAVAGLVTLPAGSAAASLAESALTDESAVVRFEALRAYGRLRGDGACTPALAAVHDPDAHVALLAIDQLDSGCGGPAALPLLDSLAGSLVERETGGQSGWHRAAHALVSLARVDEGTARRRLADFSGHGNAFVRAWSARAARIVSDTAALRSLALDTDPNVRTAAVVGLRAVEGHGADAVYIAQILGQTDSQLLRTAAAALEGTADPAALPALLDALDRISDARRETWRDARVALLERITALGGAAVRQRVAAYLTDYDARVANMAADAIERWTGRRPEPVPAPLPRLDLPSAADVAALADAAVVIEMADGGRVELRLLPFDAPTNAWRFARLARNGYYDGLTFHRVEPNFVVQGGSPAANEYAGDGPYTRDEVGLAGNWRGTVGLSTRGRDTGDAQIYINLVDNVRLDHDYTVFAEVTAGMDVVDRMQEGALIRRVVVTVNP